MVNMDNYKKYTLGFIFSEDKQFVLLIRKTKPAWQAGKLNGIGGKVEEDEFPSECIRREVFEESGLQIDAWKSFAVMHSNDFRVDCFWSIYKGNIFTDYTSKTEEIISPYYVKDIHKLVETGECINNLDVLIYAALKNEFFMELMY